MLAFATGYLLWTVREPSWELKGCGDLRVVLRDTVLPRQWIERRSVAAGTGPTCNSMTPVNMTAVMTLSLARSRTAVVNTGHRG